MSIETAVAHILGDELANAIILDLGVNWAVVTAMLKATEDDDPVALATLRRWKDDFIAADRKEPTP